MTLDKPAPQTGLDVPLTRAHVPPQPEHTQPAPEPSTGDEAAREETPSSRADEVQPELDKKGPERNKQMRGPSVKEMLAMWFGVSAEQRAARKAAGDDRWFGLRWIQTPPPSVASQLNYLRYGRMEVVDGRPAWGITTAWPIVNILHALVYGALLLTGALLGMALGYAHAYLCRYPGRMVGYAIGLAIAVKSITTWLGA